MLIGRWWPLANSLELWHGSYRCCGCYCSYAERLSSVAVWRKPRPMTHQWEALFGWPEFGFSESESGQKGQKAELDWLELKNCQPLSVFECCEGSLTYDIHKIMFLRRSWPGWKWWLHKCPAQLYGMDTLSSEHSNTLTWLTLLTARIWPLRLGEIAALGGKNRTPLQIGTAFARFFHRTVMPLEVARLMTSFSVAGAVFPAEEENTAGNPGKINLLRVLTQGMDSGVHCGSDDWMLDKADRMGLSSWSA